MSKSAKLHPMFQDAWRLAELAKEVNSEDPFKAEVAETAATVLEAQRQASIRDDRNMLEASPQLISHVVKTMEGGLKTQAKMIEHLSYANSLKAEQDEAVIQLRIKETAEAAKQHEANRQALASYRELASKYIEEKAARITAEAENRSLRQEQARLRAQQVTVVQQVEQPTRGQEFVATALQSMAQQAGPMLRDLFARRHEDRQELARQEDIERREHDEHMWRLSTDEKYRADCFEHWIQMTAAGENPDADRREVFECKRELQRREHEARRQEANRLREAREKRYAIEDNRTYSPLAQYQTVEHQAPVLTRMFDRHSQQMAQQVESRMDGIEENIFEAVADAIQSRLPGLRGPAGPAGPAGRDGKTLIVDVPATSSLKNNLT